MRGKETQVCRVFDSLQKPHSQYCDFSQLFIASVSSLRAMTDIAGGPSDRTPDPTSDALRVMGNAFRARAYDTLLIFGDMTARRLAPLVRVSEASLRQHLKAMSGVGFVRPVNPESPVRQVVWHAVPGGVRLGTFTGTEEYANEARAWIKATIESESNVLQDWVDLAATWPAVWQNAVERYDYVLKNLTVNQLADLSADLRGVAEHWFNVSKSQEPSNSEDTRTVFLVTHAVPWPVLYEGGAGTGDHVG